MPEGAGRSRPVANEANLVELGRRIDAATPVRRGRARPRHRAKRRHRGLVWAVGSCVVVVALLVGTLAGYAWYLNHEVHRVDVRGLSRQQTTGADAGTENILMVGSTDRCALTVQNPAYGLCSQGVNGVNSDVVMILHLDPVGPKVSILSIPRDLFVPNARADGANKIDAALYEGPTQLVAAIEEDFGIPIQHYVELNFDTFANVVNALGGIKMYFPEPVYDQYSGLNVQTTGCQELNGIEALQVVRARHLQYQPPGDTDSYPGDWPYEAQSDLARIRRDHEFLRVLATAVAARGLSNPATDFSLVSSVAPQLTVDSGFSARDMLNLVLTYHKVDIDAAPQLTVPVLVDQFGDYVYQGGDYGDIEFTDQPQDQDVVDQFLGLPPGTNTMTGQPLPKPASVTVSVLNGSGLENQASITGYALGQLGFHVVGLGDADPVGEEAETTVTFDQRTPADEAAAQAVASSLNGSVVMAYGPTADGADVTVTTGTNFGVNASLPSPTTTTTTTAPRPTTTTTTRPKHARPGHAATTTTAPPTTTTAPPTTTTTTQPPSIADGTFSPPSAAVEPLAPWDPRSCTPSGGEGP